MAETYKILGQASPSATTNTSLYSVPSTKEAVISTISICNRGTGSANFRISTRPSSESLANKHYIVYNAIVAGNDSIFLTIGITLAPTDIVEVYASSADLSFSLYGSEIS